MPLSIPSHVHKGCLLIANPEIQGGLFGRSVMLVCEHNDVGSFGIILNKPLDIELPKELVDLTIAKNKNVFLRAGGPVQTNQMMLLHNAPSKTQQLLHVTEGVFLGGDLDYLHCLLDDDKQPYILMCFGYAGWSRGELDREVIQEHWFACNANSHAVFEVPPHQLWSTLLRGMGGKYAVMSTIPEDLSLN